MWRQTYMFFFFLITSICEKKKMWGFDIFLGTLFPTFKTRLHLTSTNDTRGTPQDQDILMYAFNQNIWLKIRDCTLHRLLSSKNEQSHLQDRYWISGKLLKWKCWKNEGFHPNHICILIGSGRTQFSELLCEFEMKSTS